MHQTELLGGLLRLAVEYDGIDKRLSEEIDRALFRDVSIRVERKAQPVSLKKLTTLIEHGRAGIALARKRGVLPLAAEIARTCAELCHSGGLDDEADRFSCEMRKSRTMAQPLLSVAALRGWMAYFLAGYGYRPYNLAIFILATILVSATGLAAIDHRAIGESIIHSGWNYLAYGASIDFARLPLWFRIWLVFQSLFAIVANGTLVALLGRRWFRNA